MALIHTEFYTLSAAVIVPYQHPVQVRAMKNEEKKTGVASIRLNLCEPQLTNRGPTYEAESNCNEKTLYNS